MKFKFRFDTVLRQRKILEDVAQRDFQEVQSQYLQQVEILDQMKNQVHEAHVSAFENQTRGGSQGPALSQIHEFLKLQDVRIERQQNKVQEFLVRVEELREILREKAIEYKMIEKLKEKKKAEFKKEKDHQDQKNADDLSSMRRLLKVRE